VPNSYVQSPSSNNRPLYRQRENLEEIQPLSKAKSKDYLPMNNNIREKYLRIAGAQNIVEAGRKES
jgi:hypothetical protein